MSNPEVGELFLKLRLDAAGFATELTEAVESGADEAQAQVDDSIEETAQKILDLRTRAEAASLRAVTAEAKGDQGLGRAEALASQLLNLQANIAQAQFAAEDAMNSAANAMGSEKEQFLAAAEAYKTAAEIGQDTLRRSQEAGRLVEPNIPGQQERGIGANIRELLTATGRSGGAGGLVAIGARLGVVGLAATTAFQAFNELQGMLRVTGDEAFTLEGKLRNAGAELLTGNIIGGIKALTADRPAELTSGLTAAIEAQKNAQDELFLSEEKLLTIRGKGREELELYLGVLAASGNISDETAEQLIKVTERLYDQAAAAEVTATAMNDVAEAISRAGSEAAAFGERGGDFGRGPGAIDRENALPTTGAQALTDPSATAEVQGAVRAAFAKRTETLADDLKEAEKEVDRIRERNNNLRNVTDGRAARYRELVEAQNRALDLEKQLAAQQQATDEAIASNQASIASSLASRSETLTDDLSAAQAEVNRIRERNRRIQGNRQQEVQQQRELVDAETRVSNIQDAIAADNQRLADEQLQAQQQAIQNDIARAALTKRKDDDIKAFQSLVEFWKQVKASADTVLEREQAESGLIDAQQRLRAAQTGVSDSSELVQQRLQNAVAAAGLTGRLSDDRKAAADLVRFWKQQVQDAEGVAKARAEGSLIDAQARVQAVERQKTELQEQRIRTRQAAAQLTAGLEDDKLAADALIAFWKKQVKNAEGLEKEVAKQNLIAAQLAKKNLEGGGRDGGPSTIDFLGISQSITREFAGNLLPTGSAEQLRGLFQLPGITVPDHTADSPEVQSANELKRIRELLERNGSGAKVEVTQNFRDPDATGFAQARFARFAMEEAFNG